MRIDEFKLGNTRNPIFALVMILLIGGLYFWQTQHNTNNKVSEVTDNESKESELDERNEGGVDEGSEMVLAGKKSFYRKFTQSDFDKAVSEGKIIYLEFYANWCPICRAQEPDLIEGINNLSRADVVGFRVNFKDDQTDQNETALAQKYKIPYQHHKIVLKDGKVVIDSAETWDSQTLVKELSKL